MHVYTSHGKTRTTEDNFCEYVALWMFFSSWVWMTFGLNYGCIIFMVSYCVVSFFCMIVQVLCFLSPFSNTIFSAEKSGIKKIKGQQHHHEKHFGEVREPSCILKRKSLRDQKLNSILIYEYYLKFNAQRDTRF